MVENLLIRLGSRVEDAINWMIWSESEQHIIASGELANANELTQLTDKSASRHVTVIVPSSDVTFKQLHVPAKSQKAIRQAVPYMLEDDLAQDVEALFFAYSEQYNTEEKNCSVAVIAHEQMTLWLSWIVQADISADIMIPDVLLMPADKEHWQAITIADQILLRQGPWQGMLVEETLWQKIAQHWEPESTIIESYSTLPASDTFTLEPQPEELPLALFAQNLSSLKINLLQGEYKPKRPQSPHFKVWFWAAGFAFAALIINMVFKSVTLMNINSEQAAIEAQIIQTYKEAFPKTKRVRISTIRSQLKRKMAEVGSSNGDEQFLTMFNKLAPAFSSVPQLKPESIKFDSKRNELRIQASASSYQQFEQFKNLLEKEQFTVSQGAQNNQGDQITGSFSMTLMKGAK